MSYAEAVFAANETASQVNEKIIQISYPPKPMYGYNVQAAPGGKVRLYFTPPSNTYIKDLDNNPIVLVEVAGVEIRKKHGSEITSVTDGELFAKVTAENMDQYITTPMVDEDVEIGEKYYYRFFPYSTVGKYNLQDNAQAGVTVTQEGSMLIFGFDQDFDDLNPGTRISYPEDVENHEYEPMNLNSENDPTFGGWRHFIQNVLKNYPFVVKRNGEADYALDPDDYRYKLDGTTSDWSNPSYQGGCFAWMQNIYYKIWWTGNVQHVRFCEAVPVGESSTEWLPLFDCDGADGIWIPMVQVLKRNDTAKIDNLTTADGTTLNVTATDAYYSVHTMLDNLGRFCTDSEDGFNSYLFGGQAFEACLMLLMMLGKTTNFNSKFSCFNSSKKNAVFENVGGYSLTGFSYGSGLDAVKVFHSYYILQPFADSLDTSNIAVETFADSYVKIYDSSGSYYAQINGNSINTILYNMDKPKKNNNTDYSPAFSIGYNDGITLNITKLNLIDAPVGENAVRTSKNSYVTTYQKEEYSFSAAEFYNTKSGIAYLGGDGFNSTASYAPMDYFRFSTANVSNACNYIPRLYVYGTNRTTNPKTMTELRDAVKSTNRYHAGRVGLCRFFDFCGYHSIPSTDSDGAPNSMGGASAGQKRVSYTTAVRGPLYLSRRFNYTSIPGGIYAYRAINASTSVRLGLAITGEPISLYSCTTSRGKRAAERGNTNGYIDPPGRTFPEGSTSTFGTGIAFAPMIIPAPGYSPYEEV